MKKIGYILTIIIIISMLLQSAVSAKFPERDIRLIASYAPGGSTDIAARLYAESASKYLPNGVTMVVENMPGAGAMRASNYVALAEPDGYTLLTYSGATEANVYKNPDCPYEIGDIIPITKLFFAPKVLVLAADSPFSNLDEFLEAAKKEKVIINTSGIGTNPHVVGIFLEEEIPELNFAYVHTQSGGDQLQQLLGGHVDAGLLSMSEVIGILESGELKGIAWSGEERNPDFPNIPTFKEKGIDVVSGGLTGLGVTAGVPEDVLEYHKDLAKAIQMDEEYQEKMEKAGFTEHSYTTQDRFIEILSQEFILYCKAMQLIFPEFSDKPIPEVDRLKRVK